MWCFSLGDSKLMAQGVLMHLLGTGPYVKYGLNNATSKLGQAAAANTSGPFSVSTQYHGQHVPGYWHAMALVKTQTVVTERPCLCL